MKKRRENLEARQKVTQEEIEFNTAKRETRAEGGDKGGRFDSKTGFEISQTCLNLTLTLPS